MKNKVSPYLIYLLFSFFLFQPALVHAQAWKWGKEGRTDGKSAGNNYGGNVTEDKFGNAYFTGNYGAIIAFGADTLKTPNGISQNVFIVKYDSIGVLLWAAQPIQGWNDPYSYGIAIDEQTDNSGNIDVLGYLSDTLYFGSYKLVCPLPYPSYIPYLVKYTPSGSVLWAITLNGYLDKVPYSIATDNSDNIFITISGNAVGEPYFNIKLNSNGTQLWANTTSGNGASGASITSDKSGNSYTAGFYYKGSVVMGTNNLTTNFTYNAFLVKYDSAGNFQWARQPVAKAGFDTLSGKAFCRASSVITDSAGNVYIAGWFDDTLIFGSYTLAAPPGGDTLRMFLVKYDSHGNVLWAQAATGGFLSFAYSLATDTLNHLYVGGIGFSDIKIQNLILQATPSYSYFDFMMEFDTAGKLLCGSGLNNGSSIWTQKFGITSDPTGKYIYIGGSDGVGDTVICGPDTLITDINGGYNPYLARWIPCNYVGEGINYVKGESEKVKVYPNPSNGVFTIALVGAQNFVPSTIEIYNVLGQNVYSKFPTPLSPLTINLSGQPNGVYLYKVINKDGLLIDNGKVIIVK
jgi:hypothetical protein